MNFDGYPGEAYVLRAGFLLPMKGEIARRSTGSLSPLRRARRRPTASAACRTAARAVFIALALRSTPG